MLISLLIVPLIGSLLLLLIPENNPKNEERMKVIALSTSLVNLFISILLWIQFDSSVSGYQFINEFNELSFCHFNIGIDGISLYYVLLTTFVTPIALLSNYKNIYKNVKYFLISFLILETLQIALFVVLDLFLFYIFFESVLPILFIIIIVYGSGVNRIRSALLFFLYTLAGSLFMLLAVLQIYSIIGSTDFQFISLNEISLDSQKILWLAFFLAFATKTPLWPLTGWLYRAHADSPLAGSILLAGTILKFATYGALCLGLTQICAYKLPNSGDALKLLIPSRSRKATSGQNNYLGMVISQDMTETEMGYRGSKSEFIVNSVKEQRVDGSCFGISPKLRCTLMGREICYQTKNPSKQFVIPASFKHQTSNLKSTNTISHL